MIQHDPSHESISVRAASASIPFVDDDRFVEADLLARLLEGDASALRTAYDRYSSLVFGLARKVTGDHAAACDVAQDVFVFLWEHPDRVDLSRGTIQAYLGVVTHRRALDAVRHSGRSRARDERIGREEPMTSTSHETMIVDAMRQESRVEQLRSALDELPPEQRSALELAYFHGLTYREVAVRLDIPEGTAKSRLRLALARLRDLLTLQDHDGMDAHDRRIN